jgi:hypothetical protein
MSEKMDSKRKGKVYGTDIGTNKNLSWNGRGHGSEGS